MSEIIRDSFGRIIGRIEKHSDRVVVKDPYGKIKGYTCASGTYDANGVRLSTDRIEDVFLLLG